MTNEDKAREIELNVYAFSEKPKGQFEAPAYRAALEMAEWKDQQFKEYLEKKKEEVAKKMKEHILYSQPEEFYHNRVMFCNEIINELFGEEKQ